MEILFVSHKFPPTVGGMEKQSYELITGMERKCIVHRLVYDGKGSKMFFFLNLSRRIRKICAENPYINLIHFNDGLIASFYSFFKKQEHISYTATLHGLDVTFPSKIYRNHILKKFNEYSLLISVSNATARKAIEFGINPNKIEIIPNGVDSIDFLPDESADTFERWLEEKQIKTSKKLIFMMGRPVLRKGFSWFIMNVLPHVNDQYLLLIAGPFHAKAGIREKMIYLLPEKFRSKLMLFLGYTSDERNLRNLLYSNPDIKHLGCLPRVEIDQLLRYVDAFLMPNISVDGDLEGFGLVSLEASTQDTLVFAADVDGIPDAIQNEKNGVLIPSGDAESWIEKLKDLDRNIDLYKQRQSGFGQFSRDNYSWSHMVDTYYDLFDKIIKNRVVSDLK
ncbi:MAG: glycosyltransferase family 4 protein [Dysgonomonas sp.]